ncbi:MAG TPA: alpha/beta hydrolase [Candidatus Acidoferrales bacterium]|nr:alpha/beta hydrolase [Candidatus Acidoferrales bacterium]
MRRADPDSVAEVSEAGITAGGVTLPAFLGVPKTAAGLVLFAHGSGSGRHSPRNRYVADVLHREGIATLLLDLLTTQEEALDRQSAELRFDVDLLAERLVAATRWAGVQPALQHLSLGYFGASTGAAAALIAASRLPGEIAAVVSRGGRPDLAGKRLEHVTAPTLLIVGGADAVVLELNRRAASMMRAPRQLVVIPGATHLFTERGALEEVARLAAAWFRRYCAGHARKNA